MNDKTESIAVNFDTTGVRQEQLQKRIEKLGYAIVATRFKDHIIQEKPPCRKIVSANDKM